MTKEIIVEMAIEGHSSTRDAIRWAIAQEREACALICDEVLEDMSLGPLEKYRASWIANSIRSRGQA